MALISPWFSLFLISPVTKHGLFGSRDGQNPWVWAGSRFLNGQPCGCSMSSSRPSGARSESATCLVDPYTLDASIKAVIVFECSRTTNLQWETGTWGASLSISIKSTSLSRNVASSFGIWMLIHSEFFLSAGGSQLSPCASANVMSWSKNCPKFMARWVSILEFGFERSALLPWTKRLTSRAFGSTLPVTDLRGSEMQSP